MITGFAETDAIEPAALERLQRLGGDRLVSQMVALFREHGARHVETLRDSDDIDRLEAAAHSLKTSAGNLGATRLYQLARAIEAAAEGENRHHIRALVPTLVSEFARASERLAQTEARMMRSR